MSRLIRLLSLLFVCALAPVLLAQANLTLDSFATFPQLAPGSLFTVDAYYENSGPSAAADVKLTITVPPGFLYEGYKAQSPFNCTEPPKDGHGDLVCTASSLGIVDFGYVEANLRVDPAAVPGTVITMAATLTSSNAVKPSQTISGSTTVLQQANLRLAMSAPASVTLGGNSAAPPTTFPITFTVTNDGPATASFTELDVARQGLVSWSALTAPPGWQCGAGWCRIGSFPPGTATFTISATLLPTSTLTSVQEQAQVWSLSDGDSSDNHVTSSTAIIKPPRSTLALTLTAAPGVVFTGDQLTYTATITNTGNVDAQNVSLYWALSGTPLATTCGTLTDTTCNFPTLAAGATVTVTRTVRVDAGPGTLLDDGATVGPDNSDPDPSHHGEVKTTVAGTPHVDLGVTITPPDSSLLDGNTGIWVFEVTNLGPDPATDWQLTIPLPPNTTVAGGTVAPVQYVLNPGTCNGLTPGSTQVTCHGTYLSGYKFIVSVYLTVAPGTFGPVHVTATVSPGTNVDTNPSNDTAATDTKIFTTAYVSVALATDKRTAAVGDRVTQTFTATNHGPDPAIGVALNITPPPGGSLDVSSTFISCTGTAPIHCVSPSLAVGAALQTTISFQTPPNPGSYESSAVVVWDNAGTSAGSATTSDILQVLPPSNGSDVSILLDASPRTVKPGDDVIYIIMPRNLGVATASNVTVQLQLPASLALVTASPQCSGSPVVTCAAGTLNSGSMATFTVTARAVIAGTFTATATVSTSSQDLNSANNSASVTVVISGSTTPPAADVTTAVEAVPGTLNVGDLVTYTIRAANIGGSVADRVTATFNVPPSLTFVSASPSCSGDPVVTCAAGSLDSGETVGVTVTARAIAAGTITATASVSTTSVESNNGNNTAATTIVVNAPPAPARRRAARH